MGYYKRKGNRREATSNNTLCDGSTVFTFSSFKLFSSLLFALIFLIIRLQQRAALVVERYEMTHQHARCSRIHCF